MKAKIVGIGILLTGFISACGVTDSKKTPEKFNPHVDGVWAFQNIVQIPCDDAPSEICHQDTETHFVSIDYPHIHACYERSSADDDRGLIEATKEDVEVVHTNENLYRITTDNGDPVGRDTLTIKMKKDEIGYLHILKKLPDGGVEGLMYSSSNGAGYQECRKNATYSKDALYL